MSAFTTLYNVVLEVLDTAEIKSIQIREKEIKLSLFANDMILYIVSPKNSTKKKTNGTINKFSKVVRY